MMGFPENGGNVRLSPASEYFIDFAMNCGAGEHTNDYDHDLALHNEGRFRILRTSISGCGFELMTETATNADDVFYNA